MRRLSVLLVLAALVAAPNAFATTAADVPCSASSPPPNPCVLTQEISVAPLSVLDFGTRGLTLTAQGGIDAGGGRMKIVAASLVLQPGSFLSSVGGDIEVDTTGAIQVQAADTKAKVDVSGPSGGFITFIADGLLVVAGQLIADATSELYDGGVIDITGSSVNITSTGKLSAMGGRTGTGGDVFISATTGNVASSGVIDASSPLDGGSVEIDSNNDITTTSSSAIKADGGEGGIGDSIDITAFYGKATIAGIIAGASSGGIDSSGDGADLSISAVGTITCSAAIDMSGGGTDGSGGDVDIGNDTGDIVVTGPIDVSGPGSFGSAGAVDFSTNTGFVDVRSNVVAIGPGYGGDISAFSFNNVQISGRLTSDGLNAGVELQGCGVTVTSTARLSSQGTGGQNLVRASGAMAIKGPLLAGLANKLEYLDPTKPPSVTFTPSPAPTITQNTLLFPCGGPPPTTSTTTTTRPTTTSTTTTTITTTTTVTVTTLPGSTTTTATTTSTTATSVPTTSTTSASTSSTTASSSTSTSSSTTSASSTTTSTSTSGSTSTSTSTTTASTPSTTTTSTSSTTTTTRPVTCDPPDCSDGDDCTDDRCDPVLGCVHEPRTGIDDLSCRLGVIDTALVNAPAGDVNQRIRGRLHAKVSRSQKMVEGARNLTGRRRNAKLGRAEKLLEGFVKGVQGAETRHKVQPDLAGHLLDLAQSAASSLQQLIP